MNKLVVGLTVVGVVGLVLMGAGGDTPPAPPLDKEPPVFTPNLQAETAACAWALAERPEAYGDITRAPGQLLSVWLAVVAWRRAYPASPVSPTLQDELAAFSRLTSCIAVGLKADENKLPPGPNNNPPLGGLTAAEKAAADQALAEHLDTVALTLVPPPNNTRPANISDAAWFSNVAYWLAYRAASSDWIKGGHTAAPVKISDAQSVWAPVWSRINSYVVAQLAKDPAPDIEPKPGDLPPKGGLRAQEKAALDATIFVKPGFADPDVVPPPANTRPANASDEAWFTNYAYWAAYRSPTSDWIKQGHAPAPVKILNAQSVWAPVWQRMYAYALATLKQKPNIPKPAAKPPAGNVVTALETSAANAALWLKSNMVDPGVVPPPDNVRKAGVTDASWYTTQTYWAVYRSPTSVWVKQGNPPAPVKIPDAQSVWAPVWARIYNYVSTKV